MFISPRVETSHHKVVKTKDLTWKQTFSVPCPTCGAGIKEACQLDTGAKRTEPHRERKLSAAEAIEIARTSAR
jgi:ribosomal protein L11